MRKLLALLAANALVLGTAGVASAYNGSVSASLNVAIGTLPPAGFTGGAASASSAGQGGAATLPAGSLSGIFSAPIDPPLLGLLDGIGVGEPGGWPGDPAQNNKLTWSGAGGTMALNGSAYLLMAGASVAEIPLGVIGVGGTQMFHVLTLVAGTINANPYQLGAVTLMGALNGENHTLMATGVDNRTAGGVGQLVLVSPTNVSLGAIGTLASIATLTLNAPEPGAMLLGGAAVARLVTLGIRRRKRA